LSLPLTRATRCESWKNDPGIAEPGQRVLCPDLVLRYSAEWEPEKTFTPSPKEPDLVRAIGKGPITHPEHPIPVVARIRWIGGPTMDVPGIARSWTREAVEVTWEWPVQEYRSDWIPRGGRAPILARPCGAGTSPLTATGLNSPCFSLTA
jgi:hypothetical protein